MSPQRQKIEFEPNIPVSMTLEFDGGKQVAGRSGPQYLYWVDGNRSMFLDPEPHEIIQQTGAKQGDALEITKTLRGRKVGWEVVHVVDEDPDALETSQTAPPARPAAQAARPTSQARPAAPTPEPITRGLHGHPSPAPVTSATLALASAFCSAIDALTEAREYARRQGIDMPITADAIRAVAISVYIDKCKGGSR